MKSSFLVRTAVGLIAAGMLPAAAMAQAMGTEVIGQPIQVTTNGVTNTVYLDPGGQLRIMTPGGNTVPGTWTAANGQLCLGVGGAQECVPYASPFQAGQPMTPDQLVRSERNMARSIDQRPAAGPGRKRRARPLGHPLTADDLLAAAPIARPRSVRGARPSEGSCVRSRWSGDYRDIAVGDRFEIGLSGPAFRPSAQARTSNNHSRAGRFAGRSAAGHNREAPAGKCGCP